MTVSTFNRALKVLKVLVICVLFMFVGPSLILLNKYIMQSLDFPYPMFLSAIGLVVSSVFAQCYIMLNYGTIKKHSEIEGYLWYKRVLPVCIAHITTLTYGNLVYLHLDIGLIQMMKSFTPVVIICCLFFIGIDKPCILTVISIFIISFGTAIACSFSPHLSIYGLFCMLLSLISEAVRLVLTQFLLKDLNFSVIEGHYVLSRPSSVLLLCSSVIFELPTVDLNIFLNKISTHIDLFLLASLLGLIVNYLSYLVIQETSSLMLKLLSSFRNIFIIFVSVGFYGEIININEILGYGLALIGFIGSDQIKISSYLNTLLWIIIFYLILLSTNRYNLSEMKYISWESKQIANPVNSNKDSLAKLLGPTINKKQDNSTLNKSSSSDNLIELKV